MIILPISQITEEHRSLVGAKALSLGKLYENKFLVPEGFVITSEAFQGFLEKKDINIAIHAEMSKLVIDDIHSVDYASRVLQDLILSSDLDDQLSVEILQQFTHINAGYVAVRSSVDSPSDNQVSWTGELATHLHVSADTLIDHVKKCWASLFSTRALYYLAQKELHVEDINLAVIVQRMTESQVAGLCYSAHPVSQDKNQMVIEAGFGLGEALGKSELTPDTYVIQRKPFEIIDKNVSQQGVKMVAQDGGGTTVEDMHDEASAGNQKISDMRIEELAGIVSRIEEVFGFPVEVEWVLADEFSFVQARQIHSFS